MTCATPERAQVRPNRHVLDDQHRAFQHRPRRQFRDPERQHGVEDFARRRADYVQPHVLVGLVVDLHLQPPGVRGQVRQQLFVIAGGAGQKPVVLHPQEQRARRGCPLWRCIAAWPPRWRPPGVPRRWCRAAPAARPPGRRAGESGAVRHVQHARACAGLVRLAHRAAVRKRRKVAALVAHLGLQGRVKVIQRRSPILLRHANRQPFLRRGQVRLFKPPNPTPIKRGCLPKTTRE